MLIACPSCAASYEVEMASLCPDGRQVRCLCCGMVWHAEPTHAQKLLAAAAALGPDPETLVSTAEPAAEESTPATAAIPAGEIADQAGLSEPPAGDAEPVVAEAVELAVDAAFDEPVFELDAAPAETADAGPPIVPDDADADAGTIDSAPLVEFAADDHVEPDREPAEDFEPIAAYRLRRGVSRPAIRWPLSQMQSGILVMALISIAVVGWRHTIVRTLPQTASFYALLGMPVDLRGLTFDDVVTTTEQHDGVPVLMVEGNIFNDARKIEDVPRLKFVVRNAARQEIYSWTTTPARSVLPPGEMMSFRSRLASPPPDAHDLVLRFVSRHEFITGAR
jgi:predicted Zn finger-like uncharacterized protein